MPHRSAVLQSPLTPSAPEISRCKLKETARWIRDDLDVLVAREGPDVLHPDDVLMLHDLFVALRRSTAITALDLRATGMHKAVKDIAGIATRWPSRLCDDCDQIIAIWTSRFGPFDELHPFLFGRGGRLEGIASALLKRWAQHCPDKIHHKVSHRAGCLGFKAGDWWINSLFAHHAGIIGLESVEGGTTYDKNGAYALVLKDRSELETQSEGAFTYRCPVNDKGKFRLTAATPSSRHPIRVLRSHSINSIWGPRASIRFEGLYSVTGWCFRQAKLKDLANGEWREGDIIYEVTLQRNDPVSMDEVAGHPTNMEVDDYAEYNRVRKLHRQHRRREPGSIKLPQQALKTAPPITPLQSRNSGQSLLRNSPGVSRTTTFTGPDFATPRAKIDMAQSPAFDVSPMSSPGMLEPAFTPRQVDSLAIPTTISRLGADSKTSSSATPPDEGVQMVSAGAGSLNSSAISVRDELKEILPWIELEDELPTPLTFTASPAAMAQVSLSTSMDRLEEWAAAMNPVKNVRRLAREPRQPYQPRSQSQRTNNEDTATNDLNLELGTAKSVRPIFRKERGMDAEGGKGKKRLLFGKNAGFFDGAEHSADDEGDGYTPSSSSQYFDASSVDYLPHVYSPRPVRLLGLRNLFDYGIERTEFASPLDKLIPRPMAAPPVDSLVNMSPVDGRLVGAESIALGKLKRWLSR